MQFEIEFLIGWAQAPPWPKLSVWVHDTPDVNSPGAKQVYESTDLICDNKEKKHCYSVCESPQTDCYKPGYSVDAVCDACTGKYVTIKFVNNACNVQVSRLI